MSGGSWDYFYYNIDEVADRLCDEKSPLRRALGQHMRALSHAMHEIEWVDSGDKSSPDDTEAIKAVFEELCAKQLHCHKRRVKREETMELIPCKNLDYDSDYIDCEIETGAPHYPDVKYWKRNNVPYEGAAVKVQFCKLRGRINGIFDCYNVGEMSCHEVGV